MINTSESNANKSIILIITTLASVVTCLIPTAIPIALPSIGKEFSMEAIILGWVATIFVLASAVTMVPFGRIADIYGRRRIFIYGILLSTVSSLCCAISNSTAMLISFRALQGVGGAMVWGPTVAILTSVFTAKERGRAIGINTGAVYVGLSLGPFFGGLLTQHFGWRSIFYCIAILCALVAILTFWKLKEEWAESRGEKFDIVGSLLLSISLIVMVYGFTVLPTTPGIVLVLLGILGMLVFTRFEAKTKSPLLNVSLLGKNRVFIFSNLAALVHYCATYAPVFLLSLYFQYNKGLSPQSSGLILVIPAVIMAISTPIAGRLSDKIEPLRVASIGIGVLLVSLYLLSLLTEASSLGNIIIILVVFGLGAGFFASPNTNAVMSSVERKFFGVASGTLATMRHSGQVISMGIIMILFATYIGKAQITPEYYPAFLISMKTGFLIYAALSFVGLILSLTGGKLR